MSKGSLSLRKDGRWMGRFTSINKKIVCVYAHTKLECANKLAQAIKKDKEENIITFEKDMKLSTWIVYWYEKYQKPLLKDSTQKQYDAWITKIMQSPLSTKKMRLINENDGLSLIDIFNSDFSKRNAHRMLEASFDVALKVGYIKINPFAIISKTKVNVKKEQNTNPLTIDQEQKLLKFLEQFDYNFYRYIFFLLNTGLRKGESLALTKKDINFETNLINVDKNFVNKKIVTTKTESGVRKVPILPNLKPILEEILLTKNNEERLFNDYSDSYVTVYYARIVKRLGMDGQRIHNLRHTFASKLYKSGVDLKVIQSLLGHKDFKTTINTYVGLNQSFIENELKKVIQN